jgi:hypothetical protein
MRLTDDMLTHSSAPWMWRPIVECIGARFFIDPFRVDARRDGVMVVVMLHNPACRHLSLHDPWWRHFALDVLTLAIAGPSRSAAKDGVANVAFGAGCAD